jgi:PAS domain S-box-containing protein
MNKTVSILVADDFPLILQAYSEILRAEGYEVWEASTGQQALQLTREKRPHLVLLDVMLPDLSGMEVCRQIKAEPALTDVFVVLASGVATSVAHKVDGFETGADDYLVKPLDITEFLARLRTIVRLRNTMAALRASEQRHRQLVEILPEGVGLSDLQGRFLTMNPRGAKMLGYASPDQLVGQSVFDVTRPEDHERVRADIATALKTGTLLNAEYLLLRKGGAPFPAELSAVMAADANGQATGLVLVGHETTERKRAEEQIRLLADAVQSTQELIWVTDQENRFTFTNQAFLQTYGHTAEEIMGKTPDLLYSARNPPGLGEQVFQQTLLGGWKGEILNRRKDGTEFPISLSTSQIKNAEGKTIGLIAVARDISERKRAEKWAAAFSQLGFRLSTAIAPDQAAQIVLDIASDLFGWDAGYVHLYSESKDRLIPVLTLDTVGGQRTPVQPTSFTLDPSPLMRLVMQKGAQLINRDDEAPIGPHLVPFGDTTRRSASMMYVPIRSGSNVIGILSVQSYAPRAYSQDDLRLLQTLADHCGDALRRIKVAESLWEAEVRYHDIVTNATEGIFQTTPEGRFRTANPALAHMLGYQTPEELMAGVTDLERQLYVRPEQRQELKRLLETQESVRAFESEHYRKDGSIIWVSINAHAVRDISGTLQYYEGTIRDITESKWVENLLRRQRDFGVFLSSTDDLKAATEQLLKIVLENESLDGGAVYLLNPETKALDLSAHRGLSAGFAKRASHFAAVPVRDRLASAKQPLSWEQAPPLAGILRRLRREGLLALEALPIQYGGQVVAVLTMGARVRGEFPAKERQAIDALAAQAGGAIARIRAEQSMRASRQLLEKTIYNLQAAVFIVDARTTTIQECNPAAIRMFGHSREEMIGQTPSLLHLNEAMREEFRRHLSAGVKEKGLLSEFEFEMRRKDGTSFPAEATLVPIRNEKDQIVTWVGVFRDITERKQTEAGLRQLSRRILEAQEAERQHVARELHDSVNQVIASAKMRVRRVAESALLHPAARELLTRCDELLVHALEENRRIAHHLRPGDLDALGLAEACRNLCRQFEARTNLMVKTRLARLAQRWPPATELNLYRIVQEALNNVAKHARAKTVRLQIALQRGGLMLRIQDDGRGFDPIAVKSVRRKGEGFGLSNMRERAAILGATCEVESAPNEGTTITVRVPGQDQGPVTQGPRTADY